MTQLFDLTSATFEILKCLHSYEHGSNLSGRPQAGRRQKQKSCATRHWRSRPLAWHCEKRHVQIHASSHSQLVIDSRGKPLMILSHLFSFRDKANGCWVGSQAGRAPLETDTVGIALYTQHASVHARRVLALPANIAHGSIRTSMLLGELKSWPLESQGCRHGHLTRDPGLRRGLGLRRAPTKPFHLPSAHGHSNSGTARRQCASGRLNK